LFRILFYRIKPIFADFNFLIIVFYITPDSLAGFLKIPKTKESIENYGKKDKRIDTYIANSKPFAQPILKTHPGGWFTRPVLMLKRHGNGAFRICLLRSTLCSMAAFKEHMAFGFWKASIMKDPTKFSPQRLKQWHFGRITDIKDFLQINNILI